MISYIFKGITPIKVNISALVFEEDKKDKAIDNKEMNQFMSMAKSEISKKSIKSKKSKKSKKKKDFYPPKKVRVKRTKNSNNNNNNNNSFETKKLKNNIKLIDIIKKKRHSIKNVKKKEDQESVKSDKVRTRKSIIDYQAEILKTREKLMQMENQKKDDNKTNKEIHESKFRTSEENLNENKDINKDTQDSYDNYELNHMDYYEASEFDRRSCLRTYWSIILREHYVIFTFLSRNDYNLFYIKIERFFILIFTEMTMNGMFFVHETMYKKKTGGTSIGQKIPQFLFSLIVSNLIEVLLCYLSMTDVHYYEIKALIRVERDAKDKYDKSLKIYKERNNRDNKDNRDDKIFNIMDCIKKKLVSFLVFTFLVFLFHWYFISAFCAVYQNTQMIFLRDSGISILISLIYPFIIYGITCIIRVISLSLCCKRKLSCLYKVSELIPIFWLYLLNIYNA